uniref:Peroxidase n=1 Tax=Kalanchoe fedtschenkoi TaxID=63787 RepID=A0A7N0TSN0_KALFE
MAVSVVLCLLAFGLVITAHASTPELGLNKTCIDEPEVTLQVGLYDESCPTAELIVSSWVQKAVEEDPRMAASLLRLHFHDCFVNGCDGSVLLEDTADFVGEKTAPPNLNSLRGFEVIDDIKAQLELVCPQTVSCADILAIAARDSVALSSGPRWEVPVGRKDSLFASYETAASHLPSPASNVTALVGAFQDVGLTLADLVALSGAHTIGKAKCSSFSSRLSIGTGSLRGDPEFLQSLLMLCYPSTSISTAMADLDLKTPTAFDNQYYINLLRGEGLLVSDEMLVENEVTQAIVELYAANCDIFLQDFAKSMVRMGSLAKRQEGEVRVNCRFINYNNIIH